MNNNSILRHWRFFANPDLLFFLLLSLIVTALDSLGITVFFPVLSYVASDSVHGSQAPGELILLVQSFFESIGLSFTLLPVLAFMAAVIVAKGCFQFSASVYQAWVTSRFYHQVASTLARGYFGLSYNYFLTQNTGSLTNLVINDANRAMIAFMRFAMLFPPLITISILGAIALKIEWRITLISAVFGASLFYLLKSVARVTQNASIANTQATNHLSHLLTQALNAFKYLTATRSSEPILQQISQTLRSVTSSQFKLSLTSGFIQNVNEPAVGIFLVFLIWFHVVHANRPIGEVIVLALVFYRLLKETVSLQSNWQSYCAMIGSVNIIIEKLDALKRESAPNGSVKMDRFSKSIKLKNVSFAYGSKTVLSQVNLEIPVNQVIAFVGESGAGKSTLVDLITGILVPQQGQILIDGTSYSELDLNSLRTHIGYVTQDSALFDDTVLNNVSLWKSHEGSSMEFKQFQRALDLANAGEFVSKMPDGHNTVLGDRATRVSGGQKQRLSIARELFKDPWLLILDEATSALDSESELQIQNAVDRLRGHVTIVIIAHRMSTIKKADWIYLFKNGNIAEEGKFEKLNSDKDSNFARMCKLQGIS